MLELLRRYSGPYRKYFVVGPACKLIEVLFDLFTPLVIARMIDRGVGARDVHAVVMYGLLLVAMATLGILFTLVCQKMAALASQGMGTVIRGELYEHINELSYAELDRFGTPSLITRITNDVNQVQLAVALPADSLAVFGNWLHGRSAAYRREARGYLPCFHAAHWYCLLGCDGALRAVFQADAAKARPHCAYLS